VLKGVKNIIVCIANANSPEAAKIHNSIFSLLQMLLPCAVLRQGACPLPAATARH